jgi:hypothetical protein
MWVYDKGMTEDDRVPARRGRPATGQTPKRYIRAGAIWDEAAALAKQRRETMTTLVIRAIEREVRRIERSPGKED